MVIIITIIINHMNYSLFYCRYLQTIHTMNGKWLLLTHCPRRHPPPQARSYTQPQLQYFAPLSVTDSKGSIHLIDK